MGFQGWVELGTLAVGVLIFLVGIGSAAFR